MSIIELLATILLGLFFFLFEEFRDSAVYAFPAIVLPLLITGSLSRLRMCQRKPLVVWCLLGAIHAGLTAIFRAAFVYGGYVSYLRNVNCFGRLGLDDITYVLFAFSGALAGGVISRYYLGSWLRFMPLIGISLGVLYDINLASGFWSLPSSPKGVLLIGVQFLAPTLYGWLMALVAIKVARRKGSNDAFFPGNDSKDEVLGCVLMYLWLWERTSSERRGRTKVDKNSIGPIVEKEFDIIHDFRLKRGISYRDIESAFWCSEFVQSYGSLTLEMKRDMLRLVTNERFRSFISRGRARHPHDLQSDAFVNYLTSVAFEALGISQEEVRRKFTL